MHKCESIKADWTNFLTSSTVNFLGDTCLALHSWPSSLSVSPWQSGIWCMRVHIEIHRRISPMSPMPSVCIFCFKCVHTFDVALTWINYFEKKKLNMRNAKCVHAFFSLSLLIIIFLLHPKMVRWSAQIGWFFVRCGRCNLKTNRPMKTNSANSFE